MSTVVDRKVKEDAIGLLKSHSIAGFFINIITSAFLAFGFEKNIDQDAKVTWWLVMVSIMICRAICFFFGQHFFAKNSKYDLYVFSVGAVATALMWSFYPLYFYQNASDLELTSTMVVIAGFAGGSAIILAANKVLATFYVLVLLLPYSILLTLSDVASHQSLGFLGLFFALFVFIKAIKFADFTIDVISTKHQNAQLLSSMEQKVQERTEALITLSNIDSLTSLLNRKAFLEQFNALIHNQPETQSFAVLFVDLDGFKGINDTLSHEIGDQVLMMAAARIKNFNSESQLVCRWGGDEFIIVLPHKSVSQTSDFARDLIEKISEPYFDHNYRVTIGATIGISIYPEHSQFKEVLIQHADMAMYQQKRHAQGSVGYFNETLRLQLQREFNLRDQLITAIDREELRLVYQPIVNAKTGKPDAFEALLRWNSAFGPIAPDQFIPIAEQYGQIKSIGLWVLEQACQQAKKFQLISPNLTMCVNVYVAQFQDEDFVEQISAIFQKHDFAPSGLNIEITESFFASDKLGLMQKIKALQKMGVQISIDDFGTGYSSLSSMQDMGVDIVKIDKSFVDTIQGSGLSIITAVLLIAKELNYQVVVEGVETEEQANVLRDLNVTYLQGYYFSRPIESEQALEYLEAL